MLKNQDTRIGGFLSLMRRWRRALSLYNLSGLINPVFDLYTGGSRRLVFHDIDATRPELREVDRAYDIILEEARTVLAAYGRLPSYHAIDTDVIHSSGRLQRDKRWSVFMLTCFGRTPDAAPALAPKTLELVRRIPGVYQAMFSILEPGKNVAAHVGPSRAYLRYHLGLIVPSEKPPRIRLKDHYYTWKPGESVLFDDSWNHEVINDSAHMRVILMVDIRRPMPWPLTGIARLMELTARYHYATRIVQNMNALLPPPRGEVAPYPPPDEKQYSVVK
ncbi:aspartyl/asparaginyl beta-hydroxylase (cupin superfamily) [Neorhizobium huautlense]|uniref:Aspartyl/asparaginyl beta-hydroxylase (Cupin superfamily) n=1 Tax=Neorhizobium huautlense TaxID=67774 RepID=A0ABT9Q1K7_9HYPH|nr:aspartyl/asparaginyl beta-hydroxylase domain-containing protein [Neorhizobium huautlense]MDP9840611.1 aspartyl/asparaginyl beta-hydroxylase (cupin superfamily) [Neorhizobium huautlense]